MDTSWCHDGIEVQNLHLEHAQRVATDAWGRQKEQPLVVSVRLAFSRAFTSLAIDALDANTVHYGILSKAVRALEPAESWESLSEFTSRIDGTIAGCLSTADALESCHIRVRLPKATLVGSAVSYSHSYSHLAGMPWKRLSRDLCLERLSMAAVIGINDHERKARQSLFLTLWLSDITAGSSDEFCSIEKALISIVHGTAFETLEALADFVLRGLSQWCTRADVIPTGLRLRIEKPLAVPWADAPIIEVARSFDDLQRITSEPRSGMSLDAGMAIVRPYCPRRA